jgi:chemotaxis protein MotB
MGTVKYSSLLLVCAFVSATFILSGCPDANELRIQNATQRKRIEELESKLQAKKLELDQLKRRLETLESTGGAETNKLRHEIDALKADIEKKKSLIASMQNRLLYGGAALPAELSTLLEDFAKGNDMITYDSSRGVVKFKSDLLFASGSDQVNSSAIEAINSLCNILNNEQGQKFDIIVAGHTDDMRIAKPSTLAKHPTNWHLSAHRAISVLNQMTKAKIDPKRISIRGFSEYRPVEANKPNKKGNPKNRRVEIYIVHKGM